jgi:L-threonylcarbamoyladenylate synthase
MMAEAQRRSEHDERVGVLVADEDIPTFEGKGVLVEEAGVQVILCRSFAEHGLGLAIRDRLLRAASGKVFKQE